MKITVIYGIGTQNIPNKEARMTKIKNFAKIEVPDGSKISDIWEEAKISIGLIPHQEPIINRQEMPDAVNHTIVVPGSTELKDGDTLYLVFVR